MKDEEIQQSIFDSSESSNLGEHRGSLDKLKEDLSQFGLTSNQSKVYIFLGKYGSKTAPEVCKSLKLPRTETYHLLTTLQNKGIVSATFQHPIRFSATPLSKAIWVLVNAEKERVNMLERQEKSIVELWNTIPEFSTTSEEKEDKFQMLEGANQIHSKIKEMIANTTKEFLGLGSEKDFLKFYHSSFFEPLDNPKIDLKLLTSSSEKSIYIFDDIDRTKVKKMPESIQENLCFLTKDDDELLFFIKNASQSTQHVTAVWTDSASMIYSMKMLFSSVWSKSKNIHL
jgi:sugar-specific transcriptional regulator TrmB